MCSPRSLPRLRSRKRWSTSSTRTRRTGTFRPTDTSRPSRRRAGGSWPELWRSTDGGKLGAIQKYAMLLAFAGAQALDRGGQTYENARLVLRLRNAILHYRPEDVSVVDEAHVMEQRLRGKFDDNPLMAGSPGNPWWPDHALGHGAAMWTHRAARALADHVSDALGIDPNYRRIERGGWFDDSPGA